MKDITKFIHLQAASLQSDAADLMRRIHGFAEPSFHETKSASAVAEYLARHGFEIEFAFRNLPTAFRASWGKGPSVGMLGEYDALPNCSRDGSWGHGCGHNILGTAPALGAVIAKRYLEKKKHPGRIIYYGCPAEEVLAGKVYMARDGAFRDVDACIGWHPASTNSVNIGGGSALDSIEYEFFGKTAHGASAHLGRSALDAVVLFDIAINYLREHVPENVRIHTVIQHGGQAPNVVPGYAKIWLFARGKDRGQVDEIRERLKACAAGAAMATGTTFKAKRISAIYSRLPSQKMGEVLLEQFRLFGVPEITQADARAVDKLGLKPNFHKEVPTHIVSTQHRASSDEDTVSWLAPFAVFTVACQAQGTTGHHWQTTEQGILPLAEKGMCHAAKIFAGSMLEILSNAKLLAAITAEFRAKTKGFRFDPLIPKRQPIPVSPVATMS